MSLNRSPSELIELSIQELRTIASGYGLPLKRDMTAAVIAAMISAHESGPNERIAAVQDTKSRPAPGWARIELHRDPNPTASNSDVYLGNNTYNVLVRRGVIVDVPIKILRGCLMDAKVEVLRENLNEKDVDKRYTWEEVYSYPFTVHDINEGEDPRGTYEKAVKQKGRYKRLFRQKNGYFPKPAELREFMAKESNKD